MKAVTEKKRYYVVSTRSGAIRPTGDEFDDRIEAEFAASYKDHFYYIDRQNPEKLQY
jgi:hypothetical protein